MPLRSPRETSAQKKPRGRFQTLDAPRLGEPPYARILTRPPNPAECPMPFPDYRPTVPDMLRRPCGLYGDHEMIVLDEARLTYNEAERQSAALAR